MKGKGMLNKGRNAAAVAGSFAAAASFVAAVMICIALLMVTSLIPQSAIQKSAQRSAGYFSEHELFPYLVEGQFNTRQDNYADCILFNIIYHVGTDEQDSRFASLIRSSYFCREMQNVNDGFSEAIERRLAASEFNAESTIPDEARVDYFRYWHGSMVLIRPLMMLFDIVGVRLVLGIMALLLSLLSAVILWKKKHRSLAVCFSLGMICVNCWVIVSCIEYVTTFLVMGACNLWVAATWKESLDSEKRWRSILCLMTVSGVVTCFVDFLTTETLTVTMPLFLELALRMSGKPQSGNKKKLEDVKGTFLHVTQCGIVWGFSYAFMFLLKWVLSAVVLGVDAMKEALASAGERLGGTVYLGATNLDPEADFFQQIFGAVFRNETMLFGFRDKVSVTFGAILFGIVILVLFSVLYLFYDKSLDLKTIGLFALLAAIPYVRYLALSNHAFIHYFFTYRAQMVTVAILLYLVWEYGLANLAARIGAKKK